LAASTPNPLPDLRGLTAVVTGASGVVGSGIARQMVAAGVAVVLHYRTNPRAAQLLADEVTAAGGRAVTAQADITDARQCGALIDTAITAFGRLDVLINNAGVQPLHPLATMTLATWREVVDANVSGTFSCTRAAAAIMRSSGGGSITHIASIEGSQPAHSHAHYSAAKAAVIMHARSAALEYGPYGIRVNTVSPGLIDRPGLAEEWPDGVRRWHHAAPLSRLGTATDIGNACVFLASPMASWITGQNLVVDGGVSARPTW
jgi:glucose 1-dehydrogenase/3-oxoacyl-[acyl-carrier protein] reductase